MWPAAEPRAAAILAQLQRESKQFRGDRILQPLEPVARTIVVRSAARRALGERNENRNARGREVGGI